MSTEIRASTEEPLDAAKRTREVFDNSIDSSITPIETIDLTLHKDNIKRGKKERVVTKKMKPTKERKKTPKKIVNTKNKSKNKTRDNPNFIDIRGRVSLVNPNIPLRPENVPYKTCAFTEWVNAQLKGKTLKELMEELINKKDKKGNTKRKSETTKNPSSTISPCRLCPNGTKRSPFLHSTHKFIQNEFTVSQLIDRSSTASNIINYSKPTSEPISIAPVRPNVIVLSNILVRPPQITNTDQYNVTEEQ